MKYNLKLQHTVFINHFEYWLVKEDKVEVKSVTPGNYPSFTEGVFTKQEALRNLALMTSKQEGWEIVDNDDVWHKFVEEPEPNKPKVIVQIAWDSEASEIMEEEGFDALYKDKRGENLSYNEEIFDTTAEAEAYMKGISDGNGWDNPNYKIKE